MIEYMHNINTMANSNAFYNPNTDLNHIYELEHLALTYYLSTCNIFCQLHKYH